MGKVIRDFCWHQKFVPKGLYALAPGLYTFWNLQHMGKEKRPFCCYQNFVPNVLSAPAQGYIHEKTCLKSDFKEIVLKLATNGQSDGFLLTSTFGPKGLSAPVLGLYTCIKALKYIPVPGVRWAFTGPLVLWFEPCHNRNCLFHMQTTKVQISTRIHQHVQSDQHLCCSLSR